jgi:hypothetical protein
MEKNDRGMLKAEFRTVESVHRPYKWGHFDPEYIDQAVREIWTGGGKTTRPYYDLGRDDKVGNWVIRWTLWHICRYRDWRNRKNRPSQSPTVSELAVHS